MDGLMDNMKEKTRNDAMCGAVVWKDFEMKTRVPVNYLGLIVKKQVTGSL